jgi:hypothetical protein
MVGVNVMMVGGYCRGWVAGKGKRVPPTHVSGERGREWWWWVEENPFRLAFRAREGMGAGVGSFGMAAKNKLKMISYKKNCEEIK